MLSRQADQGVLHHDLGLCCVQHHTPHTCRVNPSSGHQMAFVEKLAELAPRTLAAYDHDQLAVGPQAKSMSPR